MGIRITDLTSVSAAGLTDTLVLVQSGNTRKCEVSQVKTINAADLTTGILNVARLPVVPVSLGGTGSTDAASGLSSLGGQPALTSAAPASIAQGGTGSTTAVAALDALGGITSAVVPSLVTTQLSAYALTSQLASLQNSNQVQALTTAQLSSITFSAGTGLVGGGTLAANRTFALQTSGVSAGTFGSSTQIPVLTVDDKGRITEATTSQLVVNAANITSGTLDPNRLATSGVSAGTFGSPVSVGKFTVDSKGRITSAVEVGISGSAGGTVVAVGASSSTLAISNSPIIYSGALQINLATTGVPAITAGSSTQSAVITVDTYGRVTALQTQGIQSLSPSGVVSGSYGHPERVAQFTVNVNGIITGATEAAIAIPAAAVSGLAASATSDTTNAGNIITGTLSSARISVLASSQISGISAAQVSGTITSAQITGIGSAQISGLAPSAFTDTTNAGNILTGALSASRLPSSGVVVGTYGSTSQIAALTVDSTGRITSASRVTPIFDRYKIVSTTNITMPAAPTSGPYPIVTFTWTRLADDIVSWGPQSPITAVNSSSQYMSGYVTSYTEGAIGGPSSLVVSVFFSTSPGSTFNSWTLHPGTRPVYISDLVGIQSSGATLLKSGGSINLYSLLGDATGLAGSSVVFNSQPSISAPTINGYTEGTVTVGTVGATATLAITAGTVLTATLTSATPCTFTMPAVGAGKSFVLYLKQPAAGTPTTATFTAVAWPGATAPVITATLARMDILSFVSDGVKWYGNIVQNFTY